MARVRVPPSMEKLFSEFPPEAVFKAMKTYSITNSKGEYLPWDKFKWRVNKGDNAELAWLATKVARTNVSRNLSELCLTNDGPCFKVCIPDSLQAKLHYIDKLTGGSQSVSDHPFFGKQEKNAYLVQSLLMEEAITSSQLEGASTTRKVAKEMLESERQPQNKSEQMIANNYRLMKRAVSLKNDELTIPLILELHEIATHNAIDNDAVPGEFRTSDDIDIRDQYNDVAHVPPKASSLQERMEKLCQFANEEHGQLNSDNFIHPLVKAIILHFMVAYIHPFGDGNGRTARALFYWFMLKSGYWLFEYVSISKLIQERRTDYDRAFLYTETDDNDLTYFLYHQVDIVVKAVDALRDYIERKQKEIFEFMNWVEKSSVAKALKRGQLDILKEAVKNPGRVFTVKTVANNLGCNENTARTYLNDLSKRDLLLVGKASKGKAMRYIAPADLAERL